MTIPSSDISNSSVQVVDVDIKKSPRTSIKIAEENFKTGVWKGRKK